MLGCSTHLCLALRVLLFHFLKQVGDTNLERLAAQLEWCFDCCTDVVGVHVAVVEPVATDDNNRITNLAPRLHKFF